MKTRRLRNNKDKAFWGSLIPAAVSLAGSMIGTYSSTKAQKNAIAAQKREALRQQNIANLNAEAATLNNYYATLPQNPYDDELVYEFGGGEPSSGGAQITDGGHSVPIGNGLSLLRGGSHHTKNSTGHTGIGISNGERRFEAEGGEVAQKVPGAIRIFSNKLPIGGNGVTPAKLALSGANPNKVFKAQELFKRYYGLEDNGDTKSNSKYANRRRLLRNAGISLPVEKNAHKYRAFNGAIFTTPDYIGLGTNILASALSGVYANRKYRDLEKDINYTIPSVTYESPVAFYTGYRNGAERAEAERARRVALNTISNNTASSNTSVERMQDTNTNGMLEMNKLWDDKFNKENENRINALKNEQEVRARNAAAANDYNAKVAEIQNNQIRDRNTFAQGRIESNVGMIQGIGSSIGGFLQSGIDRYDNDQARKMTVAASENGTLHKMVTSGVRFGNDIYRYGLTDAEALYAKNPTPENKNLVDIYKRLLGISQGVRTNPRANFSLKRIGRYQFRGVSDI